MLMDFVGPALNFVVVWGNLILGFLLGLNILGLTWSWRKDASLPLPSRLNALRKSWAFTGFFSTCIGLYVLNGPMAPVTSTMGRFREHRGNAAPDLSFRSVLDDKPQRLSDFKGKVVLLNFWATWCPPCVKELPELDRLQTAYKDRGLVVVALSDEARPALAAFLEKKNWGLTAGYAESFPGFKMENFRPFTVVVDREGRLQKHLFGALDYAGFERLIQPHL